MLEPKELLFQIKIILYALRHMLILQFLKKITRYSFYHHKMLLVFYETKHNHSTCQMNYLPPFTFRRILGFILLQTLFADNHNFALTYA